MTKIKTKIIGIVFTCIILILIGTMVFGTTVSDMQPKKVNTNKDVAGMGELKNAGQDIMGIIKAVGIILSVAIISVLGIKYMIGSSEERAGYKKSMLPYLIGAIILFAASNLAEVIYQFASGIDSSVTVQQEQQPAGGGGGPSLQAVK